MDRISNSRLEKSLFPYHFETQRPIVCLIFVAPLLIVYELGILLLHDRALRNGVDEMFRYQMQRFGLGELILLPILTMASLLAWHHLRRDRWKIRPQVLGGMLVESIFLGMILLWCAKAQKILLDPGPVSLLSMNFSAVYSIEWWSKTVSYLGAGIYEEFVFRLLALLPVLCFGTWLFGSRKWIVIVLVSLISSIFFALLHYDVLNPSGAPFDYASFAIRTLAGLFFCAVFLARGFGVAVGVHAAYNVLTQF